MLVVGAMGHAKEVLDVLEKKGLISNLYFFDDVTPNLPDKLYGLYSIMRTENEVRKLFLHNPEYILGVGGCKIRHNLVMKMNSLGGLLTSVISDSANIGNHNVYLGKGINIMHGVLISNDVKIGTGSLINAYSHIHHDVSIGEFCEISPGAILTGKVQIGDFSSIGSGSKLLPRVNIGFNVTIGAGSVVTKDIKENNVLVYGAPAKIIKNITPFKL